MLQLEVKQIVEAEQLKQAFCEVMVGVAKQISDTVTLSVIAQVAAAIPHLKEVAIHLTPWLKDEHLITPAARIGWFYAGQSAFGEAEQWNLQCLDLATQRLGADHPDTAASLNNLSHLYYSTGRYSEAKPLYRRSLHISEEHLGANHSNTATSLNNLAGFYQVMGRYSEAEPLLVQSLHITEEKLGADHPDTASSLNNLAGLYQVMGRYSEAKFLYAKALRICEQTFGMKHPNIQTVHRNYQQCLAAKQDNA